MFIPFIGCNPLRKCCQNFDLGWLSSHLASSFRIGHPSGQPLPINSFASHSSSLSSFDCLASIMLASIVKSRRTHECSEGILPWWRQRACSSWSASGSSNCSALHLYLRKKPIKYYSPTFISKPSRTPKSPQVVWCHSMFGHPVSCSQVGLNKTDTPSTLYYHPKKADLYSASFEEARED